jgi:hypothetical protein
MRQIVNFASCYHDMSILDDGKNISNGERPVLTSI